MDYKIIYYFILLFSINFILIKFSLLIDNPKESTHKLEKRKNTPLSGGIYLLISILIVSLFKDELIFNLKFLFILLSILLLGIFSDIKSNFSPKLRIIIQLFLIILLVLINNEMLVSRTNINFLDLIIKNYYIKIFFTVFCIITLLNGFNFMDGVNGFVSGYNFLILLTLYLINQQTAGTYYYYDFVFVIFVFYFINTIGKCFLGDNGTYILSILVSFFVINTTNNNNEISPIIAISLFWYPAIENLFTIIRRILSKKRPYLPDKLHLHSLIYRKLLINFKSFPNYTKNSLAGLILIIFLIPNFIFTYIFYNQSYLLGLIVLIYTIIYLLTYRLLSVKKNYNNKD